MFKSYVVQKENHSIYIKSGFCEFIPHKDFNPEFYEVIREALLPPDAQLVLETQPKPKRKKA